MSAAPEKKVLRAVKLLPTLTRLTDANGPLTKRYELIDGKLEKRTAAQMYQGNAQRVSVSNLHDLSDLILGLQSNQALCFGVAKKANATVVKHDALKEHPGAISRTKEHLKFAKGPAVFFIDIDKAHLTRPIRSFEECHQELLKVEPALADAPMVIVASASSYIYDSKTGKQLVGHGGMHAYMLVQSGEDIERAGNALYMRSWAKGYGSCMVSANGSLLDRSVVDASVWQSNRVDFAAGADCAPPLEQRRPAPLIVGDPAALFDTSKIADLSITEERDAKEAMARARAEKEPAAKEIRQTFVKARGQEIATRSGCTVEKGEETVRRALEGGTLGSDFVLYGSDDEAVSVREILADPTKWHGRRFSDPIEPEYRSDHRIAFLNCGGPTGPYLYSHAHGGRVFQLGDTDHDWQKRLRTEGEKETRLRDEENVRLILTLDPELIGIASFNEFTGTLELTRPIPGTDKTGAYPRGWSDTDTTGVLQYIQRSTLPKLTREKLEATIAQVAADTGRFHPVKDLLDSLKWDGTPRLDTWLTTYAGAHSADEKYLRAVSAATLIGGAARIYNPGCKNDCAMVLEGPQGIRKSTLAKVLALRDEWFSDSLPADLSHKDARDHLRGKFVVELPELAQFKKNEIETVKAFMSRQREQYRPSYGRHEIQFPRQCFFIGSTNDREYLVDETGNRRFWPVPCGQIDTDSLKRDLDQLWAEAVQRYKAGEVWYLAPDVAKVAETETAARIATDPWHSLVQRHATAPVSGKREVTPGEILNLMQIDPSQQHPNAAKRVGQILIKLGWQRGRRDRSRGQLFERHALELPKDLRKIKIETDAEPKGKKASGRSKARR